MSLVSRNSVRRGDTLIEVMFAIGFFALVAIISIAVMNSGINSAERDLELVTARNELNAQAEALRFIHSSYISEKTLPDASQQYKDLWEKIISNAVSPYDAQTSGLLNVANFGSCSAIYDTTGGAAKSPLQSVNAFVINTRNVTGSLPNSYISINDYSARNMFRQTELSSRIIFNKGGSLTSDDQMTDSSSGGYFTNVAAVEGIWDFVVTDGNTNPKYYDFYIQTCWYGPRALRPTVLDTVIRLYNPEGI